MDFINLMDSNNVSWTWQRLALRFSMMINNSGLYLGKQCLRSMMEAQAAICFQIHIHMWNIFVHVFPLALVAVQVVNFIWLVALLTNWMPLVELYSSGVPSLWRWKVYLVLRQLLKRSLHNPWVQLHQLCCPPHGLHHDWTPRTKLKYQWNGKNQCRWNHTQCRCLRNCWRPCWMKQLPHNLWHFNIVGFIYHRFVHNINDVFVCVDKLGLSLRPLGRSKYPADELHRISGLKILHTESLNFPLSSILNVEEVAGQITEQVMEKPAETQTWRNSLWPKAFPSVGTVGVFPFLPSRFRRSKTKAVSWSRWPTSSSGRILCQCENPSRYNWKDPRSGFSEK